MIVMALRMGLRWGEILSMPIRSVIALLDAEVAWKLDRTDEVMAALDRPPRERRLPRSFDVATLIL